MVLVKSGSNTGPEGLGQRGAYIPDAVFRQRQTFMHSGNSG